MMVRVRNKRDFFLGFEPLCILFPFLSYAPSLYLATLVMVGSLLSTPSTGTATTQIER